MVARGYARRVTGKAGRVDAHAAVHIVGVVAAIELETALIYNSAGNATIRADSGLQFDKGANVVAAQLRKIFQGDASYRVAYGSVHGLKLGTRRLHFDFHGGGANLKRPIHRGRGPNFYRHLGSLHCGESGLAY